MRAEIRDLRLARAVFVIVVEPRLADADNLAMERPLEQRRGIGERLFFRLVRMNADRAIDGGELFRDGSHPLEAGEFRADADANPDACFCGTGHDRVNLWREFGKIEMA